MSLNVDCHYDLFSISNPDQNSNFFQRSNSIDKLHNEWSNSLEETSSSKKYLVASNMNLNEVMNNDSTSGGGLHKTWSTPYLNNNEESEEVNEKNNDQYYNLMNVSNPWIMNNTPSSSSYTSSSATSSSATSSSYTSNSNSLLKDAINNNIEKSWLMSLKGLSKKQLKANGLENYTAPNDNEMVQYKIKDSNDPAFCLEEKDHAFDNLKPLENKFEKKASNTSQPTFLLSTNLESLSPVSVSLTDLSFGANSVSASFPSNKLLYLDSPIRITIMGSKQVGKSALAVRYLSRQESSSQSVASHAFSPSMQAYDMCDVDTSSWSQKLMLDPEELSILSRSISVELEIVDTSPSSNPNKSVQSEGESKIEGEKRSLGFEPHFRNTCIDTADAIVVMYSVTDRNSFHLARETLDWLAMEFTSDNKTSECGGFSFHESSMDSKLWHPPITCPVLLLANKSDLSHLRKVTLSEGRELAGQFSSANFFEVSVADSPYESVSILEKVVRDIIRIKKDFLYARTNKTSRYSPSSSKSVSRARSPHKEFDNTTNSISARSLRKSQSGIFMSEAKNSTTNRKHKMQSGYISFVSSNAVVNDFRSRKLGVINAACSRMLNNLIGRSSMPPELPTNPSGSPPNSSSVAESPNLPVFSFPALDQSQAYEVHNTQMSSTSTPNSPTGNNPKPDNFSFRRVFKKRSV